MKTIECQNITISNEQAVVCVPITGRNIEDIKKQALSVKEMKPDIVEWRADFFVKCENDIVKGLDIINNVLEYPIIFTFRTAAEGGEQSVVYEEYMKYCKMAALVAGDYNVEFIDVELYGMKSEVINELVSYIHNNDVKIIGSNHHFEETPSDTKMFDILKRTEELGADICKMAAMPTDKKDVSRMIRVLQKADKELKVPIITMSMGELGAITRVCPSLTKSVLTFASGVYSSAPGQIPINIVRNLLRYNNGCAMNGSIALIGFMGTGKTTVSQALSRITGFEEIDVDKYIVDTAGMEINEIFEKYGEQAFRDMETKALGEVSQKPNRIISCGGGAVLRDENVEILKRNGVIVRLTASAETIFDRVKDSTHRPILNNDMSLEHVKELMAGREPRYSAVADISVNVDSNDRILTCNDILVQLEERGNIGLK